MNLTKKHVGRWVVDHAPRSRRDCYRTPAAAISQVTLHDYAEAGDRFVLLKHARGYYWSLDSYIDTTFATQQDALRYATPSETAWKIVAVYEVIQTARKIGGIE